MPTISIKWKLLCLCIALVTAPTVTMGIFSFNTLKEQTYRNTEKTLKIISTDWQTISMSYIDQMQRVLKREEVLVQQRLNYVAQDVIKMLEILYETHGSDPPQHDKGILFNNIAEIKIGRSGYVSVLDINGNYIISRDGLTDGERFIEMDETRSNFIDAVLKSLKKLQAGNNHTIHYQWAEEGYAEPRMKLSVLSYFEPWQLIVCVNIYYTDFKSYEIERQLKNELRYKIAGQRIGENGYIWVINSKGEYVVSKKRFRDGENILDSLDRNGVPFVKKIIEHAGALPPGEANIENYSWRNMDESSAHDKVAAVTYVPEWDWIIGASAYHKDFLQGLGMIKSYIYKICISAILIGSLIAYFLAMLISNPIMQIKKISMMASRGNLNVQIDEKVARKQDEIGSLATSFNYMISSLKNMIEQKEATSAALLKANNELIDTNTLLQNEISERTQAEYMLERLRRQNELILKAAGEGIYGLDLNGNTTFVNPAAAEMIGWQPAELIGRNQHEVLHHTRADGSDYPKEECPIYAALKDGAVHHVDNEVFWRKDGSRFPVEYISTPIRDERDSLIGAVVVFRDITDRVRADKELKSFASKLEQSNEELREFAYIASHDLQEPLRKVTAFGERLIDKYSDVLGEQGGDYLERMRSAARRMQTLINGLLAYSRVTTKANPFTPTDLSTIAREVLSDLEVRIDQTGAKVDLHDLPTIDADPLQMRQLMQNLIGNALKFSKKDEAPVVQVYGRLLNGGHPDGADAYCQVTVEDNGIGFDERYAERIFGVFQRLHGRSEYEGTGIGLSVCKKIVERHGGSIKAKSNPGNGTSFIVMLPVKHEQNNDDVHEGHANKGGEGMHFTAHRPEANGAVHDQTVSGPAEA